MVGVKNFVSTVDILRDRKLKKAIKELTFYRNYLEQPSILTVTSTSCMARIGKTGPVGNSDGKYCEGYMEGYRMTSISGYWSSK